ncbi:brefeldin A resistance protein [Schizosaccharomyces octosporus yFS286]|uniref:Brefeldin A resistance protein n=1 Tax=Schizosaccharomyces octosporus (strain yFS286) TaxID=483514 RepID=S9PQK7_SCHOY|nr:brefeldin A resistance protein [Schizosaccharomyces octosporus yFS286]EPX71486.1 brefeldin A resistance protein [Schizosaccharomyces octosporus yFS286]
MRFNEENKNKGSIEKKASVAYCGFRKKKYFRVKKVDVIGSYSIVHAKFQFSHSLAPKVEKDKPRISCELIGNLEKVMEEKADQQNIGTSGPVSEDVESAREFEKIIKEYADTLQQFGIHDRVTGFSARRFKVFGRFNERLTITSLLDQLMYPLNVLFSRKPKRDTIPLIKEFDAVLDPGAFLLVIGHEGSGAHNLLKVLSGVVEKNETLEGSLTYNGLDYHTMHSQYRTDLSYHTDDHSSIATISVRRLLEFVCACRLPEVKRDGVSRQETIQKICELMRDAFELNQYYDQRIFEIRSGGEQKRISIAETMCARPLFQCWDNTLREFDSVTAAHILSRIKIISRVFGMTLTAISNQLSDKILRMFDMITVLYEGEQIFYGPSSRVKDYFLGLGYVPQSHSTIGEFVTSLFYPELRIVNKNHKGFIPSTPAEFRQCWLESEDYARLVSDIDQYTEYHSDVSAFRTKDASNTPIVKWKRFFNRVPSIVPYRLQVLAFAKVTYFHYLHDYSFHLTFIFSYIFQGFMLGSIFYQIQNSSATLYSRGSVLSAGIIFTAIQTMSEVDIILMKKSLFSEHQIQCLYQPSATLFGSTIIEFPLRLIFVCMFDIILYFLTGLRVNAGAFFTFFLFTVLITYCMASIFRFIALLSTTAEIAAFIGGLAAIYFIAFCGSVMPIFYIGWWFRWLSYANPIQYGYESVMLNEFKNTIYKCSSIIPNLQFSLKNNICPSPSSIAGIPNIIGTKYLSTVFQYKSSFLWRNCGIILGFSIFILLLSLVLANFIVYDRSSSAIPEFQMRKLYTTVQSSWARNPNDESLKQKKEYEAHKSMDVSTSLKTTDELSLCWKNLSFYILEDGVQKNVLKNLNGFVKPGCFMALLGENKSGKSVLIKILSQRGVAGIVEGEVTLNGIRNKKYLRKRIGYVSNKQIFVPQYTVRETLRLHASLRQSGAVSISERYKYVDEVIDFLGLYDVAKFIIGDEGGGLSLYHKKLTGIGIELVARPGSVLLLDEPASGLDSQSAWMLIATLRKLANAGLSIICSTSQPSSRLLNLFDSLLMLDGYGQTAYIGDVGNYAQSVTKYFKRLHGNDENSDKDPADYAIRCVYYSNENEKTDYAAAWASTDANKHLLSELDHLMSSTMSDEQIHSEQEFLSSMPFQTYKIMKRNFILYWRDSTLLMSRLAFNILAGLLIGFAFYKQGNGVQRTQNKMFSAYMLTIASTSFVNGLIPKFIYLRDVYEYHEENSAAYSRSAFILAFFITEAVINCCFGTLFFLCWYYPSGFYLDGHNTPFYGGYAWLIMMAFALYYTSFGIGIATVSPSVGTASLLSGTAFVFVQYFNGMVQVPSQLVGFWKWMNALSPYKYFLEGMNGNNLHNVPVVCEPTEMYLVDPPSGLTCGQYFFDYIKSSGAGIVYNPQSISRCEFCPYTVADEVLANFGYYYHHRWRNFGILIGYAAFNLGFAIVIYEIIRSIPFHRFLSLFIRKRVQRTRKKSEMLNKKKNKNGDSSVA